jgi:hypothetical protein
MIFPKMLMDCSPMEFEMVLAFNSPDCPAAPVWIAVPTLDLAVRLANATHGYRLKLSRGEMTAE